MACIRVNQHPSDVAPGARPASLSGPLSLGSAARGEAPAGSLVKIRVKSRELPDHLGTQDAWVSVSVCFGCEKRTVIV
jgi:hypothetical protein